MIISEITINEAREIDSIKINDSLVDYISKEEGVSIKEAPSFFVLRNGGINSNRAVIIFKFDITKQISYIYNGYKYNLWR